MLRNSSRSKEVFSASLTLAKLPPLQRLIVKQTIIRRKQHSETPKVETPTAVGFSGPDQRQAQVVPIGRAREQRPRRRAAAASRSPDGADGDAGPPHLDPVEPDWLPGHGDVELVAAPFTSIPLDDWFVSMYLPDLGGSA